MSVPNPHRQPSPHASPHSPRPHRGRTPRTIETLESRRLLATPEIHMTDWHLDIDSHSAIVRLELEHAPEETASVSWQSQVPASTLDMHEFPGGSCGTAMFEGGQAEIAISLDEGTLDLLTADPTNPLVVTFDNPVNAVLSPALSQALVELTFSPGAFMDETELANEPALEHALTYAGNQPESAVSSTEMPAEQWQILAPDGRTGEARINAQGQISQLITLAGDTWSFTRDESGRILQDLFVDAESNLASRVDYQYDDLGRLVSISQDDAILERREYDQQGEGSLDIYSSGFQQTWTPQPNSHRLSVQTTYSDDQGVSRTQQADYTWNHPQLPDGLLVQGTDGTGRDIQIQYVEDTESRFLGQPMLVQSSSDLGSETILYDYRETSIEVTRTADQAHQVYTLALNSAGQVVQLDVQAEWQAAISYRDDGQVDSISVNAPSSEDGSTEIQVLYDDLGAPSGLQDSLGNEIPLVYPVVTKMNQDPNTPTLTDLDSTSVLLPPDPVDDEYSEIQDVNQLPGISPPHGQLTEDVITGIMMGIDILPTTHRPIVTQIPWTSLPPFTIGGGVSGSLTLPFFHVGIDGSAHLGFNLGANTWTNIVTVGGAITPTFGVCSVLGLGAGYNGHLTITDAPYVGLLEGPSGGVELALPWASCAYFSNTMAGGVPAQSWNPPPTLNGLQIGGPLAGVGGGLYGYYGESWMWHTGPDAPPMIYPNNNTAGDGNQYLNPGG